MSDEHIIKVKDLKAGYQDFLVLDQVSFDVKKGEIFVILGGSGCGKSTLLKHMIGLYDVMDGEIWICGQDIVQAQGKERKKIFHQIGVMYQGGALFGSMTLLENIMLPMSEHTSLPEEAMTLLAKLKLKMVNLEGFEHYKPSEISGGMLKRAAMARALALDPQVVFLDEPSAGLDPITSVEIDDLLKDLSQKLGITFVIVTHELDSIYRIADKIIFLDKKSKGIIAQGHIDEVRQMKQPETVYRFFHEGRMPKD